MNEAPLTDAEVAAWNRGERQTTCISSQFARRLELMLAKAKAEIKRLRAVVAEQQKAIFATGKWVPADGRTIKEVDKP